MGDVWVGGGGGGEGGVSCGDLQGDKCVEDGEVVGYHEWDYGEFACEDWLRGSGLMQGGEWIDYYAFAEESETVACERGVLCAVRDDDLIVSSPFLPKLPDQTLTKAAARIIAMQTFQGSLRRICIISPILGEGEIPLEEQFCGGFIDPGSLNATGFVRTDGEISDTMKGYICPLGQICRVCPVDVFRAMGS